MQLLEKNKISKYMCDKCDMSFGSKYKLRRHEQSQHIGQQFKCNLCKKLYTRKDNLKVHMKIQHKIGTKKDALQCADCGTTFSKKSHLCRHESIGSKTCEICATRFCTLKQVQEHKRKLHSNFTCIHCAQCFEDNANLMRHNQNAINEDGILKNKCKICDARFCTVVWLNRHSKEHTPETFKCSICDKTFTTRWRHNQHVKTREEQPCNLCGNKFCNISAWKVHRNATHN
jgi:KRAB domain-containing zinc finger protein